MLCFLRPATAFRAAKGHHLHINQKLSKNEACNGGHDCS